MSAADMRVIAGPSGTALARLVTLLGALTACTPFAIDMYLAGIPDMVASLETDPGKVQLGMSMFFFGLALGQLIYGPVIDRHGRKRPQTAAARRTDGVRRHLGAAGADPPGRELHRPALRAGARLLRRHDHWPRGDQRPVRAVRRGTGSRR